MYASDWLAGTRTLTAAETGIYITIICMIYEKGGPIEIPRRRLARLCGTTAPALNRALDVLIEAGKLDQDGEKLSNVRALMEIEKRVHKIRSSKENANARWAKNPTKSTKEPCDRMKSAYANSMRESCYPEPEPDIKERDAYASPKKVRKEDDLFELFWSTYPHRNGAKKGKAVARRSWDRIAKDNVSPNLIIQQAQLYATDRQVQSGYAKDPATWLNQKCWEDETEPAHQPAITDRSSADILSAIRKKIELSEKGSIQ